jgi:putative ABC transport system ATP-binding protein
MVTHEEDIAKHAHRIVKLKDGEIESDTMNKNPIY